MKMRAAERLYERGNLPTSVGERVQEKHPIQVHAKAVEPKFVEDFVEETSFRF